jgi:hypothetical protein
MRFLDRRNISLLFVYTPLCAGGVGCYYPDDCRDMQTCPTPEKSVCDELAPSAGPVVDECGVFVSAGAHGGDTPAGTRDDPFTTLQQAIRAAQARGLRHVYACGETFKEAVTLPSGVHLWGGRTCADGTWSFGESTVIAPGAVGLPLRVVQGEQRESTSGLFGLRVVAADASASDGKSSIAILLSYGARMHMRGSEVIAGKGADGEPGEDAPRLPAMDGVVGNQGANACLADIVRGAPPAVTECGGGLETIGGAGGDGLLDRGGDGAPGKPDADEGAMMDGLGGRGASGTAACGLGTDGADGANRRRGAKAAGAGTLSESGWRGVSGGDGERGGRGQGGGGGGGSRSNTCGAGMPQGGAAGGSGGGGGCGGQGGKGGGYGGGSIAIVALEGSLLDLDTTQITTGGGGRGGVGGIGQDGGYGAHGGYGGLNVRDPMSDACKGGLGGKGGRGGDAGGGFGGVSFGIASIGADVHFTPDARFNLGREGQGGLAGNAMDDNDEEGRGETIDAAAWHPFDAPVEQPR